MKATGPPTWVLAIVVVGVLVVVLSVVGIFGLLHQSLTSKAGWTASDDGTVELVTVQCPGAGIGRLVLSRQSDGAEVFAADLSPGATPAQSLTISREPEAGYEKRLDQELESGLIYEATVLKSSDGSNLDTVRNSFRIGDLQSGSVLRGLTSDGKADLVPLDDFERASLSC